MSAGEGESIFLPIRVARRNSISRRLLIGCSRRHSNCACTIGILSGHFERDSTGRCKFDFGRAVHKFTKMYCFDRFAFRSKSYYSRLKPMPIMGSRWPLLICALYSGCIKLFAKPALTKPCHCNRWAFIYHLLLRNAHHLGLGAVIRAMGAFEIERHFFPKSKLDSVDQHSAMIAKCSLASCSSSRLFCWPTGRILAHLPQWSFVPPMLSNSMSLLSR